MDIMLNKGADVLQVDYAYNTLPEFAALDAESRNQWLCADVAAAYQALCEQRTYEHIILVGKSLGTMGVGHLLATQAADANHSALWLTPLVKHPKLRAQMKTFAGDALIVIGTADSHYDAACLEEIGETVRRKIIAIDGANHGMNIPGDVLASIQVLEQIMRGVETFVNDTV
jgi:dienelactone hydrolase